jgi:hypothetical protein
MEENIIKVNKMLEFKLCEKFEIKKIICCIKKTERLTESDFKLIKTKHKKYPELVPVHHNYIFLKVLSSHEIISAVGDLLKFFKLNIKDLVGKTLIDVSKCQPLFSDFILPLFESCLENDSAYQFDFEVGDKKFSCSLYPCYIPGDIASTDIVIRPSHHALTKLNKNEFKID